MLKEDFSMVIIIVLWKRIATGRQRLLQKIIADGAAMFDELQHKIRPRLAKQNTWYRQAIGPGLRMTAVQCVSSIG